jgi:four helix bundle protein
MTQQEKMKQRTKKFALRVLQLVRALPEDNVGRSVSGQLIRSATSVGANYRAACRARTKKEFVSKMGIVEEEADESCYWLELIMEDGMLPERRVRPLWQEADELVAITVSSRKTASGRS